MPHLRQQDCFKTAKTWPKLAADLGTVSRLVKTRPGWVPDCDEVANARHVSAQNWRKTARLSRLARPAATLARASAGAGERIQTSPLRAQDWRKTANVRRRLGAHCALVKTRTARAQDATWARLGAYRLEGQDCQTKHWPEPGPAGFSSTSRPRKLGERRRPTGARLRPDSLPPCDRLD